MRRLLLALTAAALFIARPAAAGDDFRVETKVFTGKETTPTSESVTLFYGGKVYDFLGKPNEITVYDKPRGRLVLLNPTRKVRTEISGERLDEFAAKLKTWAAKQPDQLLKFAADPRFEESVDDETGALVFRSTYITYQVHAAKAPSAGVARQYREFCDVSARLNALTNPGTTPPFPRLLVNEALGKSESVPDKVQLTIAPRRRLGDKSTVVRSEHRFVTRLSDPDIRRIHETGELLVTYTPVDLQGFLRPSEEE